MPEEIMPEKIDERIDRVLAKYVYVWLWTVMFGTSVSLGFAFMNYRSFNKWGILGLLLAAILILGAVASVMSLICQFLFLKNFLIPMFFPTEGIPVSSKTQTGEGEEQAKLKIRRAENVHEAAAYLRKSVRFMILAVSMMATLVLVELIYSSLSNI